MVEEGVQHKHCREPVPPRGGTVPLGSAVGQKCRMTRDICVLECRLRGQGGMIKRSAALRWRYAHRLFPGLTGRVAQSQVFLARRLRFGLNPEPDYCYHCEGRHSYQRHRISSQALVPRATRQHTRDVGPSTTADIRPHRLGYLRHPTALTPCALYILFADVFAASAAFTRSGAIGYWRSRPPVASKNALAIAAAVAPMTSSPAPVEGSSRRCTTTAVTCGCSAKRSTG